MAMKKHYEQKYTTSGEKGFQTAAILVVDAGTLKCVNEFD